MELRFSRAIQKTLTVTRRLNLGHESIYSLYSGDIIQIPIRKMSLNGIMAPEFPCCHSSFVSYVFNGYTTYSRLFFLFRGHRF